MISKKLQEIFKGKQTTRIIETIQLSHADSGMDLYFCKFPTELKLTLEDNTIKTFYPSNFQVKLPDYSESGNLDYNVSFAAVSFKYIQMVEDILSSNDMTLTIKYRFYTEDCFEYPQLAKPILMTARSLDIENRNISISGKLFDSILNPIPGIEYNSEMFKSMKYINE